MALTRRHAGLLLLSAGACLMARLLVRRLFAHPSTSSGWPEPVEGQDQAPNRPEFMLVARNFRYSPDRLDVSQDDLVKVTIRSEDVAYSFAIDEYRIVRRVPAGGTTTFEFRADRPGTFRFYSNLTSGGAHAEMQGQLVVRPR
jgi:heme/copper-type cytochrome/quinol oxidase subunit 2